jgi:hypothetical protein
VDAEEYANAKFTAELDIEQVTAVQTAMVEFARLHPDDPDAKELIEQLRTVKFIRTQ